MPRIARLFMERKHGGDLPLTGGAGSTFAGMDQQTSPVPCHLCGRGIPDYDPAFHRIEIDETRAVDICPACVEKFRQWQGGIAARLFPTRQLKKRYGDPDRPPC